MEKFLAAVHYTWDSVTHRILTVHTNYTFNKLQNPAKTWLVRNSRRGTSHKVWKKKLSWTIPHRGWTFCASNHQKCAYVFIKKKVGMETIGVIPKDYSGLIFVEVTIGVVPSIQSKDL